MISGGIQSQITQGEALLFEIPLSAIFDSANGKQKYVWVINKDSNTVTREKVTIVKLTPKGARVSGLEAGQTIVTAGVYDIKEGQQVRIYNK